MSTYLIFLGLLLIAGLASLVLASWFCKTWIGRYESANRLAVFRIVYSVVLLAELCQLIYCEPLIYDFEPGRIENNMQMNVALYVWCGVAVLLGLGLWTRVVTILNFAFTLTTFSVSHTFEYHVDYAYTGINFLLLFAPVANRFSVDAWWAARSGKPLSMRIPAIYGQMFVLFGIGVVYADSCLWKFASHNWSHGLGVFAPASHPAFAWIDFSPILESKFLSLSAGYLTLAFELLFVPLMWFHRPRYILCLVGVGLHVGIILVFPIPWFGLCMLVLYFLVWPPSYEDAVPGSQADPAAAGWLAAHPGILRAMIVLLLVLQLNASLISKARRAFSPMGPEVVESIGRKSHQLTGMIARPIFGIVTHPVFVDNHLAVSNVQHRVTARNSEHGEEWVVPITTADGLAHPMTSGRLWSHWMFRVSPRLAGTGRPELNRLLQFWSFKEGKHLRGTVFTVERRKMGIEQTWRPNILVDRRAVEWYPAWRIDWQDEPVWTSLKSEGRE